MDDSQKKGPVPEARLGAVLGLTRETMRRLRNEHLREGQDFTLDGNRVLYTEEAAGRVAELVKVGGRQLKQLLEDVPAPKKAPPHHEATITGDTVTLRVWKTYATKREEGKLVYGKVLHAHFPDADPTEAANLVRVRVRSSEHYVRGMEIPAVHLVEDLYQCARPDPRWRGAW